MIAKSKLKHVRLHSLPSFPSSKGHMQPRHLSTWYAQVSCPQFTKLHVNVNSVCCPWNLRFKSLTIDKDDDDKKTHTIAYLEIYRFGVDNIPT